MSVEVRLRRGTAAEHSTFTGLAGEVTVDTTDNRLVVHDGSTAGGIPMAKESEIGSGSGDVTAASAFATDNRVIRSDGTGKGVQASGVTVDDSVNMSGIAALSATTIELGHATDTTLSRSSAGNVAVEGNVIYRAGGTDVALADGGTGASLTDPNADRIMFWDDSAGAVTWLEAGSGLSISSTTMTVPSALNIVTITSSATPTINTGSSEQTFVNITALATAITSMSTNLSGSPVAGYRMYFRIKDDGTARAITWGASFAARGVALPTTTVISKELTVGFIYNGTNWGCVASVQEA